MGSKSMRLIKTIRTSLRRSLYEKSMFDAIIKYLSTDNNREDLYVLAIILNFRRPHCFATFENNK